MRRSLANSLLLALPAIAGYHRGPALTTWTTGEPNAPADVAAVYRTVLDEIFPRGSNGPALVVIQQMTKPSLVEINTTAKQQHRRPDAAIAPFGYRIPIIFLDTLGLRDLWEQRRKADSMAARAPKTDLLYNQRGAAPFIERFPGAWGRLILGRVGFDRKLTTALLDVWYFPLFPESDYGHEFFRLARKNCEWNVIERDGRRYGEGPIKAEPLPYGMVHAWVDSSLFPAPKRRIVRGSVRDSASGAPLPNFVIRIDAMPLGRQGQLLLDRGPESWGTVLTNSAGQFVIPHPPSGSCGCRRSVRRVGMSTEPGSPTRNFSPNRVSTQSSTFACASHRALNSRPDSQRKPSGTVRTLYARKPRQPRGRCRETFTGRFAMHPRGVRFRVYQSAWMREEEQGSAIRDSRRERARSLRSVQHGEAFWPERWRRPL